MHAGFLIFLFIALVVLPLLSFLRHGAILRGGAVAVQQGMRKCDANASVIALHGAGSSARPLPLDSAAVFESTELEHTRGDDGGDIGSRGSSSALLGDAHSPHTPSSQVFIQARRRGQVEKRRAALVRRTEGGRDAASTAATVAGSAVREEGSRSASTDVAAAWDPTQLCADDNIRLVFLLTFSLPVFAFWCYGLRGVRVSQVVSMYCYLTGQGEETVSPRLQTALGVAPVVLYQLLCTAAFLYYAFCVYLNHRDKDVGLKRHNDTWGNRLMNWFKFRLYRPYVNLKCRVWKRYFALQLVPAYGPLPLFLFPDGQETSPFSHETSAVRGDGSHGCKEEEWDAEGGSHTTTPRRHYAVSTASARHNPFYVAVHSSNNTGDAGEEEEEEGSPHDTPLFGRPSSMEAPSFLRAHHSSSGSSGAFATETRETSAAGSLPPPPPKEESDWDEEERGQLRLRRGGGSATKRLQLTPPIYSEGAAAAHADHAHDRSSSFSSGDLTSALCGPQAAAPPAPPSMQRAHYFFAAHPHGILPWCCCVNLISNVTGRDAKLFVDNRVSVLHSSAEGKAAKEMREERGGECRLARVGAASSPSLVDSPTTFSAAARTGNLFTTTHTRTAAAAAASTAPTAADGERAQSPRGAASSHPLHPPLLPLGQDDTRLASPVPDPLPPTTTTNATPYAKGRYYVYHASLKKFVLRVDKDEAVPASAADAAVYQQRLRKEEERRLHYSGPRRTPPMSVGQRLRIRIRAVVATFPFFVPIMREIYMFHGYMDASYETCKRVLLYNNSTRQEREGRTADKATAASPPPPRQQQQHTSWSDSDAEGENTLPEDLNHLMLFPGGASEALLSSSDGPARVLLRRRKGFLRLALHTQSGLVPVYTFGETDYFDQFSTATTPYAAPLDDDSTLFSTQEASTETVTATTTMTTSATTGHHLRTQIPRCTDEKEEEKGEQRDAEGTSCGNMSPRSLVLRAGGGGGGGGGALAGGKEAQRNHMRELERRLLRDEAQARDRVGKVPQPQGSPMQGQPLLGKAAAAVSGGGSSNPSSPVAAQPTAVAPAVQTPTAPVAAGWLPRLVQAVQRLFQETFGVSLPVVRNLIPHRVTGATVVGRPIYFELPPDLQCMYTDPGNYYDREKERVVLQAAQEVYFNELQELFLKYAPRYLKDPSRRKLEIL